MKVKSLQLYLRSLATAIGSAEPESAVRSDLESADTGLQPFAELDLEQFTAFLRQSDEYRRNGSVAIPSHASLEAEKVRSGLNTASNLLEELRSGRAEPQSFKDAHESTRKELEHALSAFLKPLGLSITVKSQPKAVDAALQAARTSRIAAQLREALQGVAEANRLNEPDIQQRIASITAPLSLPELKNVASEFGLSMPKVRTTDSVLNAIVEKITGIQPSSKKKTTTTRAKPVDQAMVRQHALKLKELLERSLDPETLSDSEVNAAVGELERLDANDLQAIAHEAGLENVGKTKKKIIETIHLKLTEVRRARESIEV